MSPESTPDETSTLGGTPSRLSTVNGVSTSSAVAAELYHFLKDCCSFSGLVEIAYRLGVDIANLSGDDKGSKVRELIASLQRQERLGELERIVIEIKEQQTIQAGLGSEAYRTPETAENVELTSLNLELSSLRQQLLELRDQDSVDVPLEERWQEVLRTANRAVGRGEELKARIILPQQETTDVHLVPIYSLDRLEEYRSDTNMAFLLMGAFAGATLGILTNWATNEQFVITRISLLLLAIFSFMAVACGFWAWRLMRRASLLKAQFLPPRLGQRSSHSESAG